jgi:hypothetical protein
LFVLLQEAMPPGFILLREDRLKFADSEPEPDLAIVRGEEQDFANSHSTTAELVIEIAVSSVALDREKAAIYAEAGVAEYWIVLPGERRVEVYRRPVDGGYTEDCVSEGNAVLASDGVVFFRVDLAILFGGNLNAGFRSIAYADRDRRRRADGAVSFVCHDLNRHDAPLRLPARPNPEAAGGAAGFSAWLRPVRFRAVVPAMARGSLSITRLNPESSPPSCSPAWWLGLLRSLFQ